MWWVCVHVYTDQTIQTIDICTHCDQLGNIIVFFQVNFESSRGQRILMTHTLGMTKTLALFRDPTLRIYPQLTLRACLFVQKWSRGESCTFLGTLSRKVFLKREMNIVFVFERFMLDKLFKQTLTLIVCWDTHYEGVVNERTWTFCKNSLNNQCIFHGHVRKMYSKSWFFHYFSLLHMLLRNTLWKRIIWHYWMNI